MTTPERFRRRQRIEGGVLLVLAGLMVGQAFYFQSIDTSQTRCFEDKVNAIGSTLTVRSQVNERESKAVSDVILAVSTATDSEDVRRALKKFKRQFAVIQQDRLAHPVPPFPPGKCSDK